MVLQVECASWNETHWILQRAVRGARPNRDLPLAIAKQE